MGRLKGITVQLYERTQTGTDGFGAPIYTETPVDVDNVLVAPVDSTEQRDTLNLTGKRVVYELGIPKGDTHNWGNAKVGFFGDVWQVVTVPVRRIDTMVPLDWNARVRVAQYE